MDYSPGHLVGPYRIDALLGEGGMGRVYRAMDTRLLRPVALKVLTSDRVRGATPLREAQMAARLHHPHIATVHDVIDVGGHLHIVMEYLEGRSLQKVLSDERLSGERIVELAGQILSAVGHAHASGVIHCDLKPGNVIVGGDGGVKVLDFGLARLVFPRADGESSMDLAGTPRYMAPERLTGAHPDERTDIYSLGVILADMLKREAVDPSSASAPTSAVPSQEEARRQALQMVAATATAHDPALRFPSVADMARAISGASTTGFLAGAAIPSRRWMWAAAGLGAVAAALVAVLVVRPAPGVVANPVLAINLTAVGADPVSMHLSAALQQVLEHAMTAARTVTVARQAPDSTTPGEAGATHVLGGTVDRAGDDLRIVLSVSSPSGEVLSSERLSASLGNPAQAASALVSATESVLTRGGLPIARRTLDEGMARQVLSIDPRAFDEYAQAREYMRSPDLPDNVDNAIGLLTRAVGRDPEFALAHAALAEAYWQKYLATREAAWTDRARASALDALRLNADDPIVRYTLALIYRGMGRLDESMSEVSRAIALQPSNDDLYRLRGRLHAAQGRLAEGLADADIAIRLRPGYFENHRMAGLILYEAGRFAEAVPYFRRVTELRPSNASAYQALGTVHHAANQIPEALAAYERALALSPNANTWSNLGMLHYDRGQFAEARRAYQESVRLRPKEPVTHRNLGDTLRRLGLDAEARAEYEAAIALAAELLKVNPADTDMLSLQALCHAKLGRRAQTESLAGRVLADATIPPGPRYRAAVALVLIGHAEGPARVAEAIAAGYSRSVAARDDDLASVRTHPALANVLPSPGGR